MRLPPPTAVLALGLLAGLAGPVPVAAGTTPRAVDFSMAVGSGRAATAAGGAVRTPVLRAPRRFDLVGLRWRGGGEVAASLRVRRAGGRWSRWLPMGHDSGPGGTDPAWAGGADALQLRLSRRPRGLRAHFVDVVDRGRPQRRRARVAQTQIPPTPPEIVPRAAWGAEGCVPRVRPRVGRVEFGMVHHTVSANAYAPEDGPGMILAICRYHRNANGWNDIGYNFLVDRYGRIYEGRAGGIDQAVAGAQAQGWNSVSTSVANVGTFTAEGQTPAALSALGRLLAWKLGVHGVATQGQVTLTSPGGGGSNRHAAGAQVTYQRISGHRDGNATSCPGDALYAQLPEIRRIAAQGGSPFVPPAPAGGPAPALSLTATTARVPFGQVVDVSGRLAQPDGAPVAGASIAVQVRGATGFATVARAVTGPDGGWLAPLAITRNRALRAVWLNAVGRPAATSAERRLEVLPLIEAAAARRTVVRRALVVRGLVRPPKARLGLQVARQGSDGRFHVVARVPVRAAGGRFRTVVRLRRPALHRLRVTFAGDRRNLPGRSNDVVLRAVRP